MPRLKKTITIDIPASAMSIFEQLVAEQGYELVQNPVDDDDYDDDDDDDD